MSLLGPLSAIAAASRTVRPVRTIATGPRAGETFEAAAPTHWVTLLEFAAGPLATMTMSFEVLGTTSPALELYGTTGTLRLPFPGYYDGTLLLGRRHDGEWRTIDPGGELGLVRGLGVEDLGGRSPKAASRGRARSSRCTSWTRWRRSAGPRRAAAASRSARPPSGRHYWRDEAAPMSETDKSVLRAPEGHPKDARKTAAFG